MGTGMKPPRPQHRDYTRVLYDPTDPTGPVLHVQPETRTKQGQAIRGLIANEARKPKADERKLIELSTGQWERNEESLDTFVIGWSGLTPKWYAKWLAGGSAALFPDQVEENERALAAAGETEYSFDAGVYKDFLEDGPVFLDRVRTLRNSLDALREAEEAYRHFFSAGTSGGQKSEAA